MSPHLSSSNYTEETQPGSMVRSSKCRIGLRRGGLRPSVAVQEASLQTWVRSRAVSQPAVIGSPIRRRTIGPESSQVPPVDRASTPRVPSTTGWEPHCTRAPARISNNTSLVPMQPEKLQHQDCGGRLQFTTFIYTFACFNYELPV